MRFAVLVLCLSLLPLAARADCTSAPLGGASDLVLAFKSQTTGTQAAPANLYPSTTKEGMVMYDPVAKILRLCDGTNWVRVGEGTERGQLPAAFNFTDLTGQIVSTVVTSNILEITGLSVPVPVNVGGGISPQFRICANAGCSTVLRDWSADQGIFKTGQYLQLRQTTAATGATDSTMMVRVGIFTDSWIARTDSGTPAGFNFADVTGAVADTVTLSNTLTLTNPAQAAMSVSVAGAGSPQISINGGGWVTSGTIQHGQTLQLRLTSNAAPLTANTATVTVAGVSDTFTVTTASGVPAAFSFTDQTGVAANTQRTSDSLIMTNPAGVAMAVSVSGAGSPEISINEGAWVTSGTMNSGQKLQLRLTSNASGLTANTATVSVAGVDSVWSVTTGDGTPGAFSFTDLTGQALSSVVTSNAVTVTNPAGMPMTASVSGAGSPQLRINGGSWGSGGTINSGQTIEVRQTSSASSNTAQTATVTITGVSTTWSVTTIDDLYSFSTHTFTPCGATGQSGPSLGNCQTAYGTTGATAWVANSSYFAVNSGIQLWTVPATGTYRVTVAGAQGAHSRSGSAQSWYGPYMWGGTGAIMRGDFNFTKGQQIRILVGQQGVAASSGGVTSTFYNTVGGGGGSFVMNGTSGTASPLIVAGGGGGAPSSQYSGSWSLYPMNGGGNISTNSTNWNPSNNNASQGVTQGGTTWNSSYCGCAGGGLVGNGSCSCSAYSSYTPTAGQSFASGGTGGTGDGQGSTDGYFKAYSFGGFGGGGGAGYGGTGAGGGYTGGNSGGQWSSIADWGTGGASYNSSSTNTSAEGGQGSNGYFPYTAGNHGDGFVTISRVVTDTSPLYAFSSHTFTPCGATGRYGPTLSNCTSAYSAATWTANTSYFSMPQQGYQLWTVPETSTYRIIAAGAKGGRNGNSGYAGGTGAVIDGRFMLVKGSQLRIVVGQQGQSAYNSGSYYNKAGGGGGTFVVRGTSGTSDPLIIAGGGGGAPDASWGTSCSRAPATAGGTATQVSVRWSCSAGYYSSSPVPGYGGHYYGGSYAGCAGGGLLGDGNGCGSAHQSSVSSGLGFHNTAAGGAGDGDGTGSGVYVGYSHGGFGGGGGGNLGGAGGGGGYTGGSAGGSWSSYSDYGRGGGSFNRGYQQSNVSGSSPQYTTQGNDGDGYVTITKEGSGGGGGGGGVSGTITYSLGTGGSGGSGGANGATGGNTAVTYNSVTITGLGGSGGVYQGGDGVAHAGGGFSGGDGGALGGAGRGSTGDSGGGGGGGIGTSNASHNGGSGGDNGAAAAEAVAIIAEGLSPAGVNYTSFGTGSPSGSSGSNNAGSSATGYGGGGGGAGYWGGNGGNGSYGGGGGGASGYGSSWIGGTGGNGFVVIRRVTNGTPAVEILTSGTSYSIPANTTSIKVWAVGAGGGGSGATSNDGDSGGGGGAGGIAVKSW